MKTLYALIIGLGLVLSAGVANASPAPLDPTIILRDPTCNTTNPCIIDTGGSFALQIQNDGGGVFNIENDSGVTWTSLTFSILAPSNETFFGCDGGTYFQNCSIGIAATGSIPGTNLIEAFFTGLGPCESDLATCKGVLSGEAITVDLNPQGDCGPQNPSACGTWEPNSLATVTPNPEPETFVLLLTGFLPLLPFRKRLFSSRSSAQ